MIPNDYQENVRRHVVALRRSRGWTQEDLVERLAAAGWEISRVTLSKIEKQGDGRSILVGEAAVLADVFEVPIAALISPNPIMVEA